MNTVTDAFVDAGRRQAAPRLREIPYNYTSFSDREIVIRLLGRADVAAARRAARRAPHRALGAHAVRGAGRHLGGRPQSLPAGRPARQPEAAARCWSTRCATGCARSRSGARLAGERCRARRARSAQLVAAANAAVDRFAASFAATAELRRRTRRVLARYTDKDNIAFDGLARVSHVTDATDWRVEYPFVVLYPDTEDEVRGAGARAASSSASPSSRAAAAPATPAARSRSTRARR